MITVVKLGGSILEEGGGPAPDPGLIAALARARAAGQALVLVHGGGKTLTRLLERLGVTTRFEQGLRVTDPATLRAAVMAFAGEVSTTLVRALAAAGVPAVGLSGVDGDSVRGTRERAELGAVGAIEECDPRLWRALLAAGYVPVVASLMSETHSRGTAPFNAGVLNVNADQLAAAAAAALGAARLFYVTDVPGVLAADGRVLPRLTPGALQAMAARGELRGGMLPKADACRAALAAGVGRIAIIDAEVARGLDALLVEGAAVPGTEIVAQEETAPV